jgi:hypothetical protein
MGEQGAAVALVRLRRGVVGESKRVCHLIPIPVGPAAPDYLTALCGERVYSGQAEVLDRISGMPCHLCLVRSSSAYGLLTAAS